MRFVQLCDASQPVVAPICGRAGLGGDQSFSIQTPLLHPDGVALHQAHYASVFPRRYTGHLAISVRQL